jgi:hypothetical protein
MITLTKNTDGRFTRAGSVNSEYGRLQFMDRDKWWGSGREKVADILSRFDRGPHRYSCYRILGTAEAPDFL